MRGRSADSDRDGSRRIDRGAAVTGAKVSPADGPNQPDGSGWCRAVRSGPGLDHRRRRPQLRTGDSWLHADDSFDRGERPFEYGYFHSTGGSRVTVPTGRVDVEVSRGPEYRVERRSLQIKPGAVIPVRIVLRRLANLPADGWYSGDLHVHMNYGGTYRNTPRRLASQARAEDLHLVENLIVNKEGRIPDIAWFSGRPDPASQPGTLIAHDQEYHTSYWGHVGLLGLTRNILLPGLFRICEHRGGKPLSHQRRHHGSGTSAGRGHRICSSVRQPSRTG